MRNCLSRPRRGVACALTGVLLSTTAALHGQETLREVVEDVGAAWIVGAWSGTNAQGQTVAVEYEWELDGHLLEVDVAVASAAYAGMITRAPADGQVAETGVSNDGGVTRATWRVENGDVISERVGVRPDGREIRIAVVNHQVNADTVRATVHSLSGAGEIAEAVLDTVVLHRTPAEEDDD